MKLQTIGPVLLLALGAAACNSVLDVQPINDVDTKDAFATPANARAALAGLYDGLQSTAYYGGTFLFFSDLSGDDVRHTGTFTTYKQVDVNSITADNTTIEGLWDGLYRTVGRANIMIERVGGVPGLDPAARDSMLGTAHFIRALTYHNLIKLFGDSASTGLGVPLVLVPPPDIPSAGLVTRATTGEVYTQILADLAQAETLNPALLGPIRAIRARVFLYRENWAGAEAEAESVAAMGYALAPNYGDLFTANGTATDEDIFRIEFTAVDFNLIGYYYRAKGAAGGRREITPSNVYLTACSPGFTAGVPASYTPVDLRCQWNAKFQGTTVYGSKYPTGDGAEDLHVIRFAEILLIEAEAEARQNKLGEAEATITPVRTRAGMPALQLDTLPAPQFAVDAILQERRFELTYEGDRWPDLVRTGRAVTVLNLVGREFQRLYPIPLNELDVAPGLLQNPGY
jgi:hypothetical protein